MNELGLIINHSVLELNMQNSVRLQRFCLLLACVNMKRKIHTCVEKCIYYIFEISLEKKIKRVISHISCFSIRILVVWVVNTEK